MQKGDKFIVKLNYSNLFKIGEEVTFNGNVSPNYKEGDVYEFENKEGLMQFLELYELDQIKQLDRFPCDDEQVNN